LALAGIVAANTVDAVVAAAQVVLRAPLAVGLGPVAGSVDGDRSVATLGVLRWRNIDGFAGLVDDVHPIICPIIHRPIIGTAYVKDIAVPAGLIDGGVHVDRAAVAVVREPIK
jgi:hypothetical protein